jgi:hypothetical protein
MNLRQLQMHNLAPRGIRATCVPTSLCFVTGESYQDIDHLIESSQARYHRGKGVVTDTFLGDGKTIFGYKFSRIYKARYKNEAKRLVEIRHLYPTGTFIVNIPHHMMVLKDGEFYDLCTTNLQDYATDVWLVEKAA